MTCEQAFSLLSARTDGELPAGQEAALDGHLAECAACRAAAEAISVQDAALLRAFSPRRDVAVAMADRVARDIAGEIAPRPSARAGLFPSRLVRWAAGAVAAAVVLAVMLRRPLSRVGSHDSTPNTAVPVARMTLATGGVSACPSGARQWRPMSCGDAVTPGGRVRTADTSKCELRLADGACVRLDATTEACFTDDRNIRVESGRLWSALSRGAAPIRVSTGRTTVTTGPGEKGDDETRLEVSAGTEAATITVLQGKAEVFGTGTVGAPTTVRTGQTLRIPAVAANFACAPLTDPLQATRWQDELLVLKPGDDPELAARVGQLLARISAERASASPTAARAGPGPVEEDVRARGEAWSGPMACYACVRPANAPPEERRTAARLLADLAPAWCIPELINLLDDADAEVRSHAAAALRRLTGRDVGDPIRSAAPDRAATAAWRVWWDENRARYARPR